MRFKTPTSYPPPEDLRRPANFPTFSLNVQPSLLESYEDFERTLKAQFEWQLKFFREHYFNWVKEHPDYQLIEFPNISKEEFRHFEYLALFQVGEWTYSEIREKYSPEKFDDSKTGKYEDEKDPTRSIREGIETTAKLIGVTRRGKRKPRRVKN
jgi:outer membrane cobalamin receptor